MGKIVNFMLHVFSFSSFIIFYLKSLLFKAAHIYVMYFFFSTINKQTKENRRPSSLNLEAGAQHSQILAAF